MGSILLNGFFAIYWLVLFGLFAFTDYEPGGVTVGVAMLGTVALFIVFLAEDILKREERKLRRQRCDLCGDPLYGTLRVHHHTEGV